MEHDSDGKHWYKCPKCGSRNLLVRAECWCQVNQASMDGDEITIPEIAYDDQYPWVDWSDSKVEMLCQGCDHTGSSFDFRTDEPEPQLVGQTHTERIRRQIAAGSYETPAKVCATVDAMMEQVFDRR